MCARSHTSGLMIESTCRSRSRADRCETSASVRSRAEATSLITVAASSAVLAVGDIGSNDAVSRRSLPLHTRQLSLAPHRLPPQAGALHLRVGISPARRRQGAGWSPEPPLGTVSDDPSQDLSHPRSLNVQ